MNLHWPAASLRSQLVAALNAQDEGLAKELIEKIEREQREIQKALDKKAGHPNGPQPMNRKQRRLHARGKEWYRK